MFLLLLLLLLLNCPSSLKLSGRVQEIEYRVSGENAPALPRMPRHSLVRLAHLVFSSLSLRNPTRLSTPLGRPQRSRRRGLSPGSPARAPERSEDCRNTGARAGSDGPAKGGSRQLRSFGRERPARSQRGINRGHRACGSSVAASAAQEILGLRLRSSRSPAVGHPPGENKLGRSLIGSIAVRRFAGCEHCQANQNSTCSE